jgi:hypothetical protein
LRARFVTLRRFFAAWAGRSTLRLSTREALELYRGDDETAPLDLANTLGGCALLKGDHGSLAEAMQLWQEAGRLNAEPDVQAGVAESNAEIARLSAHGAGQGGLSL